VGPRVQLPQAIAEVFITDELQRRLAPAPDYLREKLAIQDLANHMTDRPGEILPRLVQMAMEFCGAESAGISVLEPETAQFRWLALTGVLSAFEGATTPRNFSPCGVCLDENSPVLMDHPERVYDWIREANISVPEVLLVPLVVKGRDAIGTLWIVAGATHHFDGEHARLMTELAGFVGVALRMIQTEEQLTAALEKQETLTKEMSHRVKNLFAITDAMIRMTSRTSSTKEEMTERLSGRVHALANANALVQRSFGEAGAAGVGLSELIGKVLLPYDHAHCEMCGPDVTLGDQATNNLALVFHELATNAAKYGSLSVPTGSVSAGWETDGENLSVNWKEVRGPKISAPAKKGFGSTLVETTVVRSGGTIASTWQADGLAVSLSVPLISLHH
jgi:two-component sensor histidine kinase